MPQRSSVFDLVRLRQLTFQDNLQLVSQNVKDTVTGAGLRDDMPLQPTPAGVLVKVITRLHRVIHILQEPGGFRRHKEQESGGVIIKYGRKQLGNEV